jgi:hypothetical protein
MADRHEDGPRAGSGRPEPTAPASRSRGEMDDAVESLLEEVRESPIRRRCGTGRISAASAPS